MALGHRGDLVVRSARLEGAGGLEFLALQANVARADLGGQCR
jgi:hypothetical protein